MTAFKLALFAGASPRVSKTVLEDNEAQKAVNTKLYSGEIRSWYKPGTFIGAKTFSFTPKTIYRPVVGTSVWMGWANDVDVVKGPVNDTQEYRVYYSGDGVPKKTNKTLAETGTGDYPRDYLNLGVPAPTAAPSLSSAGGSGTAETRAYVYTFVSTFGSIEEESAPSPAATVSTFPTGATVTISSLQAAPSGKYNITAIRIYRTVTGSTGTTYLFVKQVNIGTTSTTDTVAAASLGEAIQSTNWDAPPSDLAGLVVMPNGFLAGFRKNELYFSVPFQPHAWPSDYVLTTEYDIVGLGVTGSTLVVTTTGNPYVVNGTDPQLMAMEKLPLFEPCVAKRSIAFDETGVYYACPNGVVLVGPGGASQVTRNVMTREEWSKYAPSTMHGEILDGRYFLFYNDELNKKKGGVILDRYTKGSPFQETSLYSAAEFVEPTESLMYVVEDKTIKTWDYGNYNMLPYEWKSKVFITSRPINFAVMQIEGDFNDNGRLAELQAIRDAALAANQSLFASSGSNLGGTFNAKVLNFYTMNGSMLQDVPEVVDDRYIQVTVIGNDEVRAVVSANSTDMYRLPSDHKCDRWEFLINGNIPIRHIKIAESSTELKGL